MSKNIYTELTSKASLLPEHREELKTKRGFNDETIDYLRFFSGGNHIAEIAQELKGQFGENALISSGIAEKRINHRNGEQELVINPKLKEDNIIIPFLDASEGKSNGEVYHLYPHKNGFKDMGVLPYCRLLMLHGFSDTLIITESPFKAAAMYQVFGKQYCYCGLSGISSFSDKNFDKLNIHEDIKKAIIIFDNEIKDNPNFPNYKEDFWKRYDTEYYAYIMAWKLSKRNIDTRIATLPAEWMENGKIDCDGALAQGRSRKDFDLVFKNALTPAEYLSKFEWEREFVVNRRLKKYFFKYKTPIQEDRNSYYITVDNKKNSKAKEKTETQLKIPLTNFKMEISKVVEDYDLDSGNIIKNRYIQFTDSFGMKSKEFIVDPRIMTHAADFKAFIIGKGDYLIYKEGISQLTQIWEKLMTESKSPQIRRYSGIGKINKNIWLLGDCLIIQGEVIPKNSEGLYQKGFQAILAPETQNGLPYLMNKDSLSTAEILNLFFESLGFNGILLISYVPASLLSDLIFSHYHEFPLLGLFGKTSSGKTTAGKWLFSCFGIKDEPANIKTSTEKGIIRNLSRLRNLPFWADEYRSNDNRTKNLTQTLLNVYNRASSTRANYSNDDSTLSHKINGVFIISGQATPDDEALFSRIVGISLSEKERNTEIFEMMQKNQPNFSNLMLEILKKEKEIRKIIIPKTKEITKCFLTSATDPRVSENYGIAVGSLFAMIEALDIEDQLVFKRNDFIEWCKQQLCTNITVKKEKDELLSFFRDINRILNNISENDKEIERGGIVRFLITNKEEESVYLAIIELWALYEEDLRRRGKSPTFTQTDIVSYIEKEPYFKGYPNNKKKVKKFNGRSKVCIIIDYHTAKADLLHSCFNENDFL